MQLRLPVDYVAFSCSGAMSQRPNTFKEEFAGFLETPSRDLLRQVFKTHHGETEYLDFKQDWPEDWKLAKHVLALANSGGGALIVGVAEEPDKSLQPVGVSKIRDKADVDRVLRNFLPTVLAAHLHILDFTYTASEYGALVGRSYQVVLVPDDPEGVPFMSIADGIDIRRPAVYVRRMASTEEANYEELQTLLNRKIATGRSTQNVIELGKLLDDLRALYNQIDPYTPFTVAFRMNTLSGLPNYHYPRETFDAFVARMIDLKERQIESLLVSGL